MIRPDDKLCPHFREKCLKAECASYVRELGGTKVITNESTSGCSSPSCEDFFAPNGKMYISCKMNVFNEFEIEHGKNTVDAVEAEVHANKQSAWVQKSFSRKLFNGEMEGINEN